MRRPSGVRPWRSVLVDVIEHDARIETVLPAEVDTAAQPAWSLHQPAHRGEAQTARVAQSFIFVVRPAAPIGVEQRRRRCSCREAFADEVAHLVDNEPPFFLVKDGVRESGQHLEALDGAEVRSTNCRCADCCTTQSEPAASTSSGTSMAPASSSNRVAVSCRSRSRLTAICRKISGSAL